MANETLPVDPDLQKLIDEQDQANKLLELQKSLQGEPAVSANGVPQSVVNEANIAGQEAQQPQTPDQETQRANVLKAIQGQFAEQQKGVSQNQAAIDKLAQGPSQMNLQPLYNLSNSWFGGNIGAGYKPPMTEEERAQKVLELRNALQTQKKDLTAEQINLLKAQLPTSMMNLDLRTENAMAKIPQVFSKDKVIQPAMLLVNGADRIQDLLDKVKKGEISDTGQFVNNLSQEQAKLESGKTNFGEGTAERTMYDSGASRLAGLIQKITANPQSTNMPKLLNELQKNVHAMRNSYVGNIKNQANMLKVGYSNPKLAAEQDRAIGSLLTNFKETPNPTMFKGFGTEKKVNATPGGKAPMSEQDFIDAYLKAKNAGAPQ